MNFPTNRLYRTLAFCSVFMFFALWLIFYQDLYFGKELLLPRDNAKHHLPLFLYVGRYLAFFSEFPEWFYGPYGGAWLAPQANNFLLLAPYRWPGYALMWMGVDGNIAYKVSLLIGEAIFLVGLYRFFNLVFSRKWLSLFCCALAAVTSIVLCFLFQEQALGTVILLPYLGCAFLRSLRQPSYLLLTSTLLGLTFNFHYPHLVFIFLFLIGASYLVCRGKRILSDLHSLWTLYRSQWPRTLILSILCFSISAAPVLFSYFTYGNRMESPLRAQEGSVEALSFSEYDRINRYVPSSLNPANLSVYLNYGETERTDITVTDDTVLHMTPAVFFLLLALLFAAPRRNAVLFLSIALVALASIGIHGPIPYFFFHWLPGIRLFRQWFHFTSLLNLLLLLSAGVVINDILERRLSDTRITLVALLGFALTFTGTLSLYWTGLPLLALAVIARYFRRPEYTAAALALWLLVGGVYGGILILKEYRREATPRSSAYYFTHNPVLDQFDELQNTYWEPVIRVKGYHLLPPARPGSPLLMGITTSNELTTLPSPQTQHGALVVPAPKLIKGIYLNQVDDGGWIVSSVQSEPVPHYGPGVQIPIQSTPVTISRRPTIWRWLLLFMWTPLAIWVVRQKMRFPLRRNYPRRVNIQAQAISTP